ncbi:MAG TPA: peptidylprolyl isomerase [Pyrinomonadaceae bacterium]|jgi:parvulin-like peptidyl-prolyl isomerase|nr:peptidylprolyl isomerase [Pyrinomonadaceae bacterium]
MPSFKRLLTRTTIATFVSALLVLSLSCAKNEPATPPAPAAAAPDEIIATVNGNPVSRKFYEMFLRNGREALGLNADTEEGRRKLDELREGIVSELIDRALIAQEAVRRGLQVTPERLSQSEQREIMKLGGERQFAEYLQTHNLTRDEYRAVIRDMIYGELLTEAAAEQSTVSDEEIKTYYEAQRRRGDDPSLQLPERVTAAHILVNARPQTISQELQREQGLTGDALAAAVRRELELRRALAAELRREAARAEGAHFAELARARSDDAATRERGGDLGTFAHGAHTRAFDDAAFKLKPGEVSEVVETEYGYHVIKLTGREPARAVRLEEAAPEIRTRLLAEKRARLLALWLKEARGKAKVSIKEAYRFGGLKTEFPA